MFINKNNDEKNKLFAILESNQSILKSVLESNQSILEKNSKREERLFSLIEKFAFADKIVTCVSPLCIYPHSKSVLMRAINNDVLFLASQSVMDYSLLVGLDEISQELVVGIIDYIRTFTWDKKIETMVKKSGILGGQGKLPTIISPDEYKNRFIAAMHKYFIAVPDQWHNFGKGMS